MIFTITQSPAVLHPFKSVREEVNWWFLAPVTQTRVSRDGSREFDVYLIRSPAGVEVESGKER